MTRTAMAIILPVLVLGLMALIVLEVNTDLRDPSPLVEPQRAELPADPCPSTADGVPVQSTRYRGKAPAYPGPVPHEMTLVVAGDVTQAQGYNERAGHRGIGQGYGAGERGLPVEWLADDDTAPQLVVCEYVVSIGNPVQTCEYVGAGQTTLLSAVYRYRVVEARTSEPVTEFTVAGGELCPSEITAWGEDVAAPPRMLQSASFDELENALRPIVAP